MIDLKGYELILASGSPRRKAYLESIGIPFTVKTHPVDERFPKTLSGAAIAEYIAQKKLDPFKSNSNKNQIIVAADTIVWHKGNCLGKPQNTAAASQMLQQLSNSTHEVITAIAILKDGHQTCFHSSTKVTFRALKMDEIKFYIQTQPPLDKAGSYGIQDWIGQIAISKIEGSYTNVVGLPLSQFVERLEELLNNSPFNDYVL